LFKKNGLVTLCGKDTLTLSERERNLQANALKLCACGQFGWKKKKKIQYCLSQMFSYY
jgi:hypothetical protein